MENLNQLPLTTALQQLFDQKLDWDVTFHIGGEDIQAHTFMLKFRSPGLKAMINNELSYENGKIIITDPNLTAADFQTFLEFLYTDACKVTDGNVKTLLRLGDMYDVPTLLEYCTNFLEKKFCDAKIISIAELGVLYSERCSLLTKCLHYLSHKCYLNRYSTSFYWKEASPELVQKVTQGCKRSGQFTEEVLFKAIIEWSKQECTRNKCDINAENIQIILSQIIPHIKFQDLKPLTLATTASEFKLLPEDNMLDVLRKSVIVNEGGKL
uniref:BTB domain-containing protein n=1 Tax=Panagrolaimus davidi TaxID=227884 RepID=A0A914QPN7_9BILA